MGKPIPSSLSSYNWSIKVLSNYSLTSTLNHDDDQDKDESKKNQSSANKERHTFEIIQWI